MAKKYESPMSRLTQQFAHAVDWADGHDDRVEQLRQAMQSAVEGKFAPAVSALGWNPPSWWRTPEQQMQRASQLWPGINLPTPPANFVPRTETEVLLLHVPQSFDGLWNNVVAPAGYTTWRWDGVKSDKKNLRLAPNTPNRTDAVWLAFDPEHGKGARPDSLWGQPNLAGSEVFSALIQFPDWPLTWFNGASAPNLAGYQLKYDGIWSRVPYLYRWGGVRRLELRAFWAGYADGHWASPSVTEC